MLMQMTKEDDFGMVPYDDFVFLVQQLRIDALHNALVETDVASLRVHLILLLRREGLSADLQLPVWTIKKVLLSADQLCLSRMQVHVVLSIVHPNEYGWVDVEYFLRVVCTVVPYMFDAATFMEKAALIAKEKADAQAKAELEELQGLTGGINSKKKSDDEEGQEEENKPDRDAVEKALLHTGNIFDTTHRAQPTLEVGQFVQMMRHESVQQCQLSDSEVRGFIAEMAVDHDNEIPYIEHIKTWVPIIFELRKSRVYDSVLAKDWGVDAAHLVDLNSYEVAFPILPPELQARRGSRTPETSSRRGSRRGSRSGNALSGNSDLHMAARLSKGLNRASQRFMSMNRKNSKNSQRSMGSGMGSFRGGSFRGERPGSTASSGSEVSRADSRRGTAGRGTETPVSDT